MNAGGRSNAGSNGQATILAPAICPRSCRSQAEDIDSFEPLCSTYHAALVVSGYHRSQLPRTSHLAAVPGVDKDMFAHEAFVGLLLIGAQFLETSLEHPGHSGIARSSLPPLSWSARRCIEETTRSPTLLRSRCICSLTVKIYLPSRYFLAEQCCESRHGDRSNDTLASTMERVANGTIDAPRAYPPEPMKDLKGVVPCS